jgi:hypothetical protein
MAAGRPWRQERSFNIPVEDDAWSTSLLTRLKAGDELASEALHELHGSVLRLSFDPIGCRVVQEALGTASSSEAVDLVAELRGHVQNAIMSAHGNYVVQKIVEVMPAAKGRFVAEELLGESPQVSRHRYGCRVMCRLLEHYSTDTLTLALVEEILTEASELSHCTYGRHVIESILVNGLPEQSSRIIQALLPGLPAHAIDRNATFVIETALKNASTFDQSLLSTALFNLEPLSLAEEQFGFHVVRALVKLPGDGSKKLRSELLLAADRLRQNKYGNQVLAEIGPETLPVAA